MSHLFGFTCIFLAITNPVNHFSYYCYQLSLSSQKKLDEIYSDFVASHNFFGVCECLSGLITNLIKLLVYQKDV